MSALLKVSGLRAGYGKVPVLHGVDLHVDEGEILGVLGHNGMGKSTLLKTLMGIVPATGGSMSYDGQGPDLGPLLRAGPRWASAMCRRGGGFSPT
jgi:amidase